MNTRRFYYLYFFAALGSRQSFHHRRLVHSEHFFNNFVYWLALHGGNGFHFAGYWHFGMDFGEFFFFGHVSSFVVIFAVSFRLSPRDLYPVGCRGYRLLPLDCGESTPAVSVPKISLALFSFNRVHILRQPSKQAHFTICLLKETRHRINVCICNWITLGACVDRNQNSFAFVPNFVQLVDQFLDCHFYSPIVMHMFIFVTCV